MNEKKKNENSLANLMSHDIEKSLEKTFNKKWNWKVEDSRSCQTDWVHDSINFQKVTLIF